jgi:hypothetical protein
MQFMTCLSRPFLLAIISLVTPVFASAAANASTNVLIDYSYGNQIAGSTLQILADGSVIHGERTCCPPHTDMNEETLDSATLTALQEWIADAASGTVLTTQGHPTALGSSSGTLLAFHNGQTLTVHTIERGDAAAHEKDNVNQNQSAGARQIEILVNSFVIKQMYH